MPSNPFNPGIYRQLGMGLPRSAPSGTGLTHGDWLYDIQMAPGSEARLRNIGGGIARSQIAAFSPARLRAAAALAQETTAAYVKEMKRQFSIHNQTGATEQKFNYHMLDPLHGRINIPEVAGMIETGVDPHEITPTNGNVLAFEGTAGDFVFAPYVEHPGFAADPWMERAEMVMGGPIAAQWQKFLLKVHAGISQSIEPPNSVP